MSEQTIPATEQTMSPANLKERRAVVRYPCNNASISSFSFPRYERLGARVRDVSVAGIGLLTKRELKPNTILAIGVRSKDRPLVFEMRARVVSATSLSDEDWIIGCEFCTRLTGDELHAFVRDE